MYGSKYPSFTQLISTFIGYLGLLAFSNSTWANTAGVFPPVVQEGHRSLQYRVTLNPDTGAFGTRLHYQESLNDDVMLRGIVHASESATGHSKVDFVQAELFWDLGEDTDRLRHGFRFDARARGRGEPSSVSVNYALQYSVSPQWQARLAVLNTRSFGGKANTDIQFQARSQLSYRASQAVSLNLEYYSQLGAIDDFNPWKNQKHQIGPSVTWRIANDWTLYGGFLSSMNNSSPDTVYRMWVTKAF
ncbi:MAG: hypothetical protein DWQ28_01950 [Proteobacteria bacterium]|nr:MAG: hypothetical protein DWQ28_01950 [Pseudomonadota bacterium]